MADEKTWKALAEKIESYRDDIVEMQRTLTALPALGPENGGEGEVKKAEVLKKYLAELPVDEIEEINAPDDRVPVGYRPNIVAKIHGKSHERTIWIMSHMDIVPPGDLSQWKGDPYKVWVEDGKIYGRGVEDNQQGIVASFFAAKALRDLGVTPSYDVGLVLVADEETGSEKGLQYVLQERKELFRPQDLIIVPDAGDPEGTMIEVAEKSILWIRFHTVGKQCHASTPEEGVNAFKAACHLAVKLDKLYEIFGDQDPVFAPPISTFEPTKKEANVPNVNTIPGEDVFYFDCRILPRYNLEEVEARISEFIRETEEQFGVKISTSSPQRMQAAPPTPDDAPVVLALKNAVRDLRNKEAKPMGIGGGTVAAFFRAAGLPAAVWATLDEMAHQPNEYCVLDYCVGDAQVFAHIFTQGEEDFTA